MSKPESKQLTMLAENSTSISHKASEPRTEARYQTPHSLAHSKRPPMKKEATLKNAKGLVQKAYDDKRGNHKKRKFAHSKRPSMKKEATPKNAKGLVQNTSDEKRGNPEKCKGAHSKRPPMKKEATLKKAMGLTQKQLR
jgi:hypothetical protein